MTESDPIARALLWARTAGQLRPSQWVYWPLRRTQRLLPALGFRTPQVTLAEGRWARLAAAAASWGILRPDAQPARALAVLHGRFEFLNETREFERIDWRKRQGSHLWSHQLQYFEYALDLAWAWRATGDPAYKRGFEALALSWIRGTRSGRGDGWEPYTVSVRVVHWFYALLLFGDALAPDSRREIFRSLARQCAWLEQRLERHLLANHLQKNLQALTLAGLVLRGGAADRWRSHADELWHEVLEQVLPDGGHGERSPMYHAMALRDLLETVSLVRAAGLAVPQPVVERLVAMVRAFGVLSRPDGRLHLFNDAADGFAAPRAYLDHLARLTLGEGIPDPTGLLQLPNTGYYGFSGTAERFIVDCGAPGPSYQPAHAHCDLLSFELDLAGRPVIVDSGTSGYAGDPLRGYQRSTVAHNTVRIGGREQSEIWGTFRMGRRAEVVEAALGAGEGGFSFQGAGRPFHDRAAVHHRGIERNQSGWEITDRVVGADGAIVESFLHLHPDFELSLESTGVLATAGAVRCLIEPFGHDEIALTRGARRPDQGWYACEFGRVSPASVIELRLLRNQGRAFGWRLRPVSGRS